mgnify:FL=1
MKKKLTAILVALVAVLSLVSGCAGKTKTNVTMKDNSTVVAQTNGGFSVLTDKYVYFINGYAEHTGDNKYGVPVKGALMVADVNDLSKTEIVAPKLVSASDYNAGIYFYDGYIYYATPSAEKTTTGAVANDYLEFYKVKIDGSSPEKLTRIYNNSAEYKIVNGADGVSIIYHDTENKEIKIYNAKDGKTLTVATEITSCKFSTDPKVSDVVYTKAVKDPSDEDATLSYNNVFTVNASTTEEPTSPVLNGAPRSESNPNGSLQGNVYTLVSFKGDYVLYSYSEVNGTDYTRYCAVSYADMADASKTTVLTDSSVLTDSTLVKDAKTFFVSSTVNSIDCVLRCTVDETGALVKEVLTEGKATFISCLDGVIYYYNSDNRICSVADDGTEAESTVLVKETANTSWYAPEVVTIAGVTHVLFSNADTLGLNYVFDAKITDDNKEFVKDEDGNDTEEFYYGVEIVGAMNDADSATRYTSIASTKLPTADYDVTDEDDKEAYDEVKAEYDALTDAQKKLVSDTTKALLDNIDKSVEIVNKMNEVLKNYSADKITKENVSSADKAIDDVLTVYDDADSAVKSLVNDKVLTEVKKAWNKVLEVEKD